MKFAARRRRHRTGPREQSRSHLREWLGTPPGRAVLDEEQALVSDAVSDLFGFHIVQIGDVAGADLLGASRILGRSLIDIDGTAVGRAHYPTTRGEPTELPVDSHAVDVVMLPHVLEFEPRPHDALREAFRILRPEGHLVLCGFNPWSAMGLWQFARRHRRRAPWSGQFLAMPRIRDWLALLGFEVLQAHSCFFRPPVSSASLLQRLAFIENAGGRLGGALGGSYVLVARKRVTTLTPIRPRWSARPRLVGVGLAEPSARSSRRG